MLYSNFRRDIEPKHDLFILYCFRCKKIFPAQIIDCSKGGGQHESKSAKFAVLWKENGSTCMHADFFDDSPSRGEQAPEVVTHNSIQITSYTRRKKCSHMATSVLNGIFFSPFLLLIV